MTTSRPPLKSNNRYGEATIYKGVRVFIKKQRERFLKSQMLIYLNPGSQPCDGIF